MDKKLVIWICDDDPVFLDFVERLIQTEWEYKTRRFSSPETLYDALRRVEKLPDCVFLDILFGQDTSLKVGAAIREHYPSVRIVYVTGYRQFLPEVFEADPVYFLEKPVDANKLKAAFEAAKRSGRPKDESDILTIQKGKSYMRIPIAEIDYIESDRRKICAYCGENSVIWNERLPEVEKRLPEETFARPHKSYLVNMNHIERVDGDEIYLFSGIRVPIAQRRSKEFRKAFAWFTGSGAETRV